MSETTEVEIPEDDGLGFGEFTPVTITNKPVQQSKPGEEVLEIEVVEEPEEKVAEVKEEVKEEEEELEIEVVDDVPAEDRNRKPSTPPKEVTDEELENYSKKAAARMRHLSKGYHDERRAKEQAERDKQEYEGVARRALEENKTLKSTVDKNRNVMVEQAKLSVGNELELARKQFRDAYDAGDSEKLVAAQEAIATAKIRADRVANVKLAPLQEEENKLQSTDTGTGVPVRDPAAEKWRSDNTWYDAPGNEDMSAFALGFHHKLLKEGIDPRSDTYYERLDARMREVFPATFDDSDEVGEIVKPKAKPKKKASSTVVAPATRSTAPKKVTLSATQVAISKKLGVPLELYAAQVAKEARESK